MAIYEEKQPRVWISILILLLVFAFVYPLWHIGARDLFWDEGTFAAAAMEQNVFPPVMQVHHVLQLQVYPLQPLLVKGLYFCGMPMEFSLRFLSVLSLFSLAAIVFIVCRRTGSRQTAAVGTVILLTSLLTVEKAVEGYPHTLLVLILYGGWSLWFEFAAGQSRWNKAWITAGIFASLAFYCGGWGALLCFLIPIFAQPRPIKAWTKLRYRGLLIGAVLLILTILFWRLPILFAEEKQMLQPFDSVNFGRYFRHIFYFPIDVFIRFFPWSLFLWAPFCEALIPLERAPLFAKFHRRIFYAVFLMLWLYPGTKSRDILLLAPVIAVLLALSYRIMVRRYGIAMFRVLRICAVVLIILSVTALLYLTTPYETVIKIIPGLQSFHYYPVKGFFTIPFMEASVAFLCASAGLFLCYFRKAVWMVYAILFTSAYILYGLVVYEHRKGDTVRSNFGWEFRQALSEADGFSDGKISVIYKDSAITGLANEGFYIGRKIHTLDLNVLPPKEIMEQNIIYLITVQAPSFQRRNWEKVHEINYKGQNIYLYKGTLRKDPSYDTNNRIIQYDQRSDY